MFDNIPLATECIAFHEKASAHFLSKGDPKAKRHAEWARAIREILDQLAKKTKRQKQGPANIPTIAEALAYGVRIGMPPGEIRSWFDHFESNGWKVSGKTSMKNWQTALNNGFRRYCRGKGIPCPLDERTAGHETVGEAHGDPRGWDEFRKQYRNGLYSTKEFRYAKDFMKTDFYAWKRDRGIK